MGFHMISAMKRFLLFLSGVAWLVTLVILFNVFTQKGKHDLSGHGVKTPEAIKTEGTADAFRSTVEKQGILPVLVGESAEVLMIYSCIRYEQLTEEVREDFRSLKKYGFKCAQTKGEEFRNLRLSKTLVFCENNRKMTLLFGSSDRCS